MASDRHPAYSITSFRADPDRERLTLLLTIRTHNENLLNKRRFAMLYLHQDLSRNRHEQHTLFEIHSPDSGEIGMQELFHSIPRGPRH
jgi:hypothetical protein